VTASVPAAFGLLSFLSTCLGGAIALRTRSTLRYFFAFSAGTLLAIALTDLLPEAIMTSEGAPGYRLAVFYVILASFVLFHVVERYVLVHHVHGHEPDEKADPAHGHDHAHAAGGLGASGLVAHSFLDGVAIGAAFQASAGVGLLVALAVITHDFADGLNTVTLTRRVSASARRALGFLLADATAPVAGVLATLFLRIPETWLSLALAFFTGHFLYIGASDLIPEMYRGERSWGVVIVHLLGILAIVILTRIVRFKRRCRGSSGHA
jgi:zinc and cadmium transporter